MSEQSPTTLLGCLVDVSSSMHEALESGHADERASERLHAVLRAALKLAQAEQQRDHNALVFVGAFGLNRNAGCPPLIDLCGVIDALLDGYDNHQTGHELLIALANQNNMEHITRYIRTKLNDDEARIINAYLRRHPEQIEVLINAIPSGQPTADDKTFQIASSLLTGAGNIVASAAGNGAVGSAALGFITAGPIGLLAAPVGLLGGAIVGGWIMSRAMPTAENVIVEQSEALKLARRICTQWLADFTTLVPRPVADIIHLLQRLQEHPAAGSAGGGKEPSTGTLLDTLRQYMYGDTPMQDALCRARAVFSEHPNAEQSALVLISDGESTDSDPLPLARELQQLDVTIATVYLTGDQAIPRRRLYDEAETEWNKGQRALFDMATRIAGDKHPIPVLVSMGWKIPSSGECALCTTVCSAAALDEFCSLLLSARFGSADALLDIVGRVRLDEYINDEYMLAYRNPSDQEDSATCYAHATATVVNMALLRITGREGGCPSIKEIRERILRSFPATSGGHSTAEVLKKATAWYRPLRFRKLDEDGARQAVLHRRPVLATFRLSKPGWAMFSQHFDHDATRGSVLTRSRMEPYRSLPDGGGHAVVLISCHPRSLTFLNSWGKSWGDGGKFSVENPAVLESDGAPEAARMCFYDVFWLQSDLTEIERQAYNIKVDKELHARSKQCPSILNLETRCPHCCKNAPIANFSGSIRRAVCPLCKKSFQPEPEHLVKALYAQAGLNDMA